MADEHWSDGINIIEAKKNFRKMMNGGKSPEREKTTQKPKTTSNIEVTDKVDYTKMEDPSLDSLYDSDWVKRSFLLGNTIESEYKQWLRANRYFSTADLKFTSTGPGMSLAVNPKPSFTRTCDIRRVGRLRDRGPMTSRQTGVPHYTVHTIPGQFNLGMGTYYSEAIDDNEQRIFMRFGEPQYTSLLLWLGRSFDIEQAVLLRRGFISKIMIWVVKWTSKLFAIYKFKWYFLSKYVLNFICQPGKFVSIRDNMYTYWTTVETTLNSMYVKRTGVPGQIERMAHTNSSTIGAETKLTAETISELNKLLPDIVPDDTGGLSVHSLALKAQMAYGRTMMDNYENMSQYDMLADPANYRLNESHDTYFTNKFGEDKTMVRWLFNAAYTTINIPSMVGDTLEDVYETIIPKLLDGVDAIKTYINEPVQEEMLKPVRDVRSEQPDGTPVEPDLEATEASETSDGKDEANSKEKQSAYDKWGEYLLAELQSGSAFAIFNVKHTGSIGESFSNSSKTNPIETGFNSLSSKARSITGFVGAVTEVPIISGMVKGVMDMAATALSEITLGLANPLLALLYGVQVSLPKSWESASASMPKASYSIRLQAPYGQAYSQIFNMYLPLAMLLAGGLPRSTGADTYTSPFMCQLFDKGRVNIDYGMIDSLSVTRGTSNLAFTRGGHPNAIDVDFSVVDLNDIIALDIKSNGVITRFMDQLSPNFADTSMDKYINALTGVDPYDQVFLFSKFRLKLAERMINMKTTTANPASLASFAVNGIPILGELGRAWKTLGNNNVKLNSDRNII